MGFFLVGVNLSCQFLAAMIQSSSLLDPPPSRHFRSSSPPINTHWANDHFPAIRYSNHKNAVNTHIYLQQVPLRLATRDDPPASPIVLPENGAWWECLVDRLEHTHIWTVAAATSIAWVIIAFVLTIAGAFAHAAKWNGEGVGSIWLWLILVVVGWLWIPVCSYNKLSVTIDKANNLAFVAAPDCLPQINGSPNADAPRHAYDISRMRAIRMSEKTEVATKHAARTASVFNYARIWEWWRIVETIARAFEHADANAGNHVPVNHGKEWLMLGDRRITVHRHNGTGTIGQVQTYRGFVVQAEEKPAGPLPSGAWERIFVTSVFALGLQRGTTGSAVMILTPTTGLGCRSGAYVLYGIPSTMVWLALHYPLISHITPKRSTTTAARAAKSLATFLRRLSILAASCNTIWIVTVCVPVLLILQHVLL
jgi:hypothetical protein